MYRTKITRATRRPLLTALLLPLLLAPATPHAATEIEVKPGDSLRGLAEQHLGDAELWQEFLRANGLESVVDVRPGMHLKLPPAAILDTQRLLADTQAKIDEANGLRASVFAPTEIARSIALRDQALDEKRRRNWTQGLTLVTRANQSATQAIEICRAKQNIAAEAQLTDRRGSVEQRTPGAVVWKDAELYGMLNEGDKLRTLANSSAEILFRDESRLRMDENSQLMIQQMRANLIENRQQAKVSLISGDLFAVLGANRKRNNFDVEIPGVKLAGDSKDFFVQRDEKNNTRFANYQGQLEVAAQGGRVALEQNEGVAVTDQGLTGKRRLLEGATGLDPRDGTLIYTQRVGLAWQPVEGAGSYWLELSSDPAFKAILYKRRDLKTPSAMVDDLPQGLYYWRVSAVDGEGFPGTRSSPSSFRVVYDHEPPFLVVYHPDEGETVHQSPLELNGIVEKGGMLQINGNMVEADAEGDFSLRIEPNRGLNRVELRAEDAAGNLSTVVRNFIYHPEPELFLEIDPDIARGDQGQLLALGDTLHLAARTLPNTRAELLDKDQATLLRGVADAEGRLTLELPAGDQALDYTLRLTSVGGGQLSTPLKSAPQQPAPQITLTPEPPRFTASAELLLSGRVERAEALEINGTKVAAPGGEFRHKIALQPGDNPLELRAHNARGNGFTLQRLVVRDSDGPQVVGLDLTATQSGDRTSMAIRLQVRDRSPLRSGAEFELSSGSFQYRGRLRLSGDGEHLTATVELPPGDHRKAQFSLIAVEDQLGNRTEQANR